jgi:hypothetical protein
MAAFSSIKPQNTLTRGAAGWVGSDRAAGSAIEAAVAAGAKAAERSGYPGNFAELARLPPFATVRCRRDGVVTEVRPRTNTEY